MPLSDRANQILAYLNSYLDDPPKWQTVPLADVQELNSRLNELVGEVPAIEEACVPDRAVFTEFRSDKSVVSTERFVRAMRHARALILRSPGHDQAPAKVSEVVGERFQVLADLVQAYLADTSQDIEELPTMANQVVLSHPGLQGGTRNADRIISHLNALDDEGLIKWRRRTNHMGGTIIIPTRVLEAPDIKTARTGREIMQIINNQPTYHHSNVAYGGVGHALSVNAGLQPGDIQGFIDALRDIGIQEPELSEFRESTKADDGLERAQSVALRIYEGAAANATGSAVFAAVTNYQRMLELVQRFWGLF